MPYNTSPYQPHTGVPPHFYWMCQAHGSVQDRHGFQNMGGVHNYPNGCLHVRGGEVRVDTNDINVRSNGGVHVSGGSVTTCGPGGFLHVQAGTGGGSMMVCGPGVMVYMEGASVGSNRPGVTDSPLATRQSATSSLERLRAIRAPDQQVSTLSLNAAPTRLTYRQFLAAASSKPTVTQATRVAEVSSRATAAAATTPMQASSQWHHAGNPPSYSTYDPAERSPSATGGSWPGKNMAEGGQRIASSKQPSAPSWSACLDSKSDSDSDSDSSVASWQTTKSFLYKNG